MNNRCVCRVLTCLTFALAVSPLPAVAEGPATAPVASTRAGGGGGAEAYYQWLTSCLDGIQKDLPALAGSAEAAARLYVEKDYRIASYGDMGFEKEINNRSGGLMSMEYGTKVPADWKGIVLAAVRDDHLDEDLAAVAKLQKQGCAVLAIARGEVLRQAKAKGAKFDWAIDNHAAEHGGLFQAGADDWVIATDTTANLIAAWTWTGEFVAACTRLGKMPTMFQSYAVDGSKDRAKKLKGLRFHPEPPQEFEAGKLGGQYLQQLRRHVQGLHAKDMDAIRAAAGMAFQARGGGKGVYLAALNHAVLFRLPCAHDGGYFSQINNGYAPRKDAVVKAGDFVYCIGYASPFLDSDSRKFDQLVRNKGAMLAWSIAAYQKDDIAKIPADQALIDQQWQFGDAVVDVSGYDIKVLPASGVMAEATLWLVAAELHTLK